jgi:Kef-type K+ transport system membrane component KefB
VVYSVISYLLPQVSGIFLGRYLGLSWVGSTLLGATYASQTLIAYPVLSRLGIISNRAVAVTMGATILIDITALLVLGVTTSTAGGNFSFLFLGRLILFAVFFALLILLAVPRLGKLFFQRIEGDAVEFQFVLVVLFGAAVGAEAIGMHTIVGAFLAGLAVNATLSEHSKVIGHVHFMGDSFFIPLFLLTVGMRLDPLAVVTNRNTLLIGLALTAVVYLTKGAAAWITGKIYGFSFPEVMTTWGLSQAHAAATLAAILVGKEAGLFSETIFNAAILTVLFTSLTSPILVNRFGEKLTPAVKEARQKQPVF